MSYLQFFSFLALVCRHRQRALAWDQYHSLMVSFWRSCVVIDNVLLRPVSFSNGCPVGARVSSQTTCSWDQYHSLIFPFWRSCVRHTRSRDCCRSLCLCKQSDDVSYRLPTCPPPPPGGDGVHPPQAWEGRLIPASDVMVFLSGAALSDAWGYEATA